MKTCEFPIDFGVCGAPATAVIKLTGRKLVQVPIEEKSETGRGTGSTWRPVCEYHKTAYPDHDGFDLDAAS